MEKYFLVIRNANTNEFFKNHARWKRIVEYINKFFPNIITIQVWIENYKWIDQNNIIIDNATIDINSVFWAYFCSSWWSINSFWWLYDLILSYHLPSNLNDYSIKMRSKIFQAIFFKKNHIPHPTSLILKNEKDFFVWINNNDSLWWQSKFIFKLPISSGGIWVHLLDLTKKDQIFKNKEKIFSLDHDKETSGVLIQEFITWVYWRDYRFIIMQGDIIIVYTRYNANDFKSNYKTWWTFTTFDHKLLKKDIFDQINTIVKKIYIITNMPYFTADFLISELDEIILCEINPVWAFVEGTNEEKKSIVKKYLNAVYNLS